MYSYSQGTLTSIGSISFSGAGNQIKVDSTGSFVYVTNASADLINSFSINPGGTLTSIGAMTSIGTNLNGLAVHPNGKFAYSAGTPSGKIYGFTINSVSGVQNTQVPGSPYTVGTTPHDLDMDPTGSYLYVVNRTSNTVSGFSIDASTGALTALSGSPFSMGVSTAPNFIKVVSVQLNP